MDEEIIKRLEALEHKYSLTGQDLVSNLEGLQYSNYLKYWDYVMLDTLLTLQIPRTDFPDEVIFITYHQITELYFKLILWEIRQLADSKEMETSKFLERLNRVIRYFKNLIYSFDIMVEGMEVEQFRQFRMALLPASGFQSAQFRMIEICSTDFINLIDKTQRTQANKEDVLEELFPLVYWKKGASDEKTKEETITSRYFQEKYEKSFMQLARDYQQKNIWRVFQSLNNRQGKPVEKMREYDYVVNVEWRLVHFKAAVRYLKKGEEATSGTGGTNWQKYLPPRFQKTIFFPDLWSEEEKEEWGRIWVEKHSQD